MGGATAAAMYLRLSKDDDRQGESNSIAAQRAECRAYAERQGWTVQEFVDDGYSASKGLERPGYLSMMEAAHGSTVQVLLASKQDRFTRDRDDEFSRLKAAAVMLGLEVHTVEAGDLRLSTAMGGLTAGIRAEFAAFEAALISARTKSGLAARREQGEWTTAGRVFGYDRGGVINQEQATHIRWAYRQILDQGKTPRHVFDTWRAKGVLTANGKPWSNVARVISMLRMPAIAGLVTHKGERVGAGNWQPIVSPEDQERLSALISSRSTQAKGYGRRSPRRHYLAGLVLCGSPGCDLKAMNTQNSGGGRAYYFHCDRRRGGCGNRTHGPRLQEWTTIVGLHLLNHLPAPAEGQPAWDGTRLAALEAQAAEIRSAMADMTMRVADAIPALNILNAEAANEKALQAAHQAAQQARSDWHGAQLDLIDEGNPEAVRAILDNVRVLPEHEGFVFESHQGHAVRVSRNSETKAYALNIEDIGALAPLNTRGAPLPS